MPSGAYQATVSRMVTASGSSASRSSVTRQTRATVRSGSPPSMAAVYMSAG